MKAVFKNAYDSMFSILSIIVGVIAMQGRMPGFVFGMLGVQGPAILALTLAIIAVLKHENKTLFKLALIFPIIVLVIPFLSIFWPT
jgi:hypothetical protein